MAGNVKAVRTIIQNAAEKKKMREKYAKRNATDKILSSSARHQAQQRMNYITENGLDREDAQLSRKELNRNIGATETENLRWQSRHGGARDYVAERAAKATKARQTARSNLQNNGRNKNAKENIDKGINKDKFWGYARDAWRKDNAKEEAEYQMKNARTFHAGDQRDDEYTEAYRAFDKKAKKRK